MEQGENNLRSCRKCLTGELAGREDLYRTIADYIDNLDPDRKAGRELYEERLRVCKECGMLFQGMCLSCGCYVEMRAAIGSNGCPKKKW